MSFLSIWITFNKTEADYLFSSAGSYCIYQYDQKCPPGMLHGFIKWDDEGHEGKPNFNQALGTLPNGSYTYDTQIFYCCQNDSSWYEVIELPITSPFYLLPYKSSSQNSPECQRVKFARATLEYIRYDTEHNGNQDTFYGHHVFTDNTDNEGPKVYYCYYESKFGKFVSLWLRVVQHCAFTRPKIIKY